MWNCEYFYTLVLKFKNLFLIINFYYCKTVIINFRFFFKQFFNFYKIYLILLIYFNFFFLNYLIIYYFYYFY